MEVEFGETGSKEMEDMFQEKTLPRIYSRKRL